MINKTIKSELHIEASKRVWRIFILINVVSVAYTLATLAVMLIDAPNLYMLIGIFVAIILENWYVRKVLGETQPVTAELMMDDDLLQIDYNNVKYGDRVVKITVDIPYAQIQRIEYSDHLNAFRFAGNFEERMDGQKAELTRSDSWVLYVKDDDSLVTELERYTKKNIVSVGSKVDRWRVKIKNL